MGKKKTKTVAVLNSDNVLIGYKDVSVVADDQVEVPKNCGLSVKEKFRYNWDLKTFELRGAVFQKINRPKVTQENAVYLLMKAFINGDTVPQECIDYTEWYEDNIKNQEDELKAWRNK